MSVDAQTSSIIRVCATSPMCAVYRYHFCELILFYCANVAEDRVISNSQFSELRRALYEESDSQIASHTQETSPSTG